MKILLLTTGGTIDGNELEKGTIREISSAASWLRQQETVEVVERFICNKDSREMTDLDRALIIDAIKNATTDRIIVTHGTFTIAETGRALKQALANTSKTVLLVGAWTPFGENNSDAESQMKFALEALQEIHPGVHIAMDGRLWNPDTTEKVEIGGGKFQLVETIL